MIKIMVVGSSKLETDHSLCCYKHALGKEPYSNVAKHMIIVLINFPSYTAQQVKEIPTLIIFSAGKYSKF